MADIIDRLEQIRDLPPEHQESVRDKAIAEIKELRRFVDFADRWVTRGPPHGGEGNEAIVVSAIKHHPVLTAWRKQFENPK